MADNNNVEMSNRNAIVVTVSQDIETPSSDASENKFDLSKVEGEGVHKVSKELSLSENNLDSKINDVEENPEDAPSLPPTPPPPYTGDDCNFKDREDASNYPHLRKTNATCNDIEEDKHKHTLKDAAVGNNMTHVNDAGNYFIDKSNGGYVNRSGNIPTVLDMGEKEALLKREDEWARNDVITEERPKLIYKTSDSPPVHLMLFFAIQQCLMVLPSSVKATFIVSEVMCARDEESFKAQLLTISLMMSGICTFLQNSIGVRLPVYQGPIVMYVLPLLALLDLPEHACPERPSALNSTILNGTAPTNGTVITDYLHEVVVPRFLRMSGTLMVAGAIHMLIGLTGTVGLIMRFIGPITVIPTMLLIAVSVYPITYNFMSTHWGISSLTGCVAVILSMYLDRRPMPIPVWTRSEGFHIIRYPLHQVFSIMIAACVGWSVAAILTNTGKLSDERKSPEFYARTDSRNDVIGKTPWFVFPYPGMYGTPGFDVGMFASFMMATLTSIIDSIADYYACSRVTRVPSPPAHAMNRGIMVEGFMSFTAGTWGAGHATTTYGGNIGVIGITKVASRRVFQLLGCLLVLLGIVGKVGSVFITIPYPVIGGLQVVGFGIFIGLVFGNLQYIDMNSTRNLAIIGLSILVGLIIPYWSKRNGDSIQTGIDDVDNMLRMLTTNPNFFGCVLACFLDNTIPGTLKERGMIGWSSADFSEDEDKNATLEEGIEIYEIPRATQFLQKFRISSYIPIFPTYKSSSGKKIK